MKKLITIISIIALITAPIAVSAEFCFDVVAESEAIASGLLDNLSVYVSDLFGYAYVNEVAGKLYNYKGLFDVEIMTAFYNKNGYVFSDYIWTGNGYIARKGNFDGVPAQYKEHSPLYYFDNEFNMIKEIDFDGYIYVNEINFYDGVYYCKYLQKFRFYLENGEVSEWEPLYDYLPRSNETNVTWRAFTVMSTDLENWTEIDKIPDIPNINGNIEWFDGKISVKKQGMKNIIYEGKTPKYARNFGEWYVFQKEGTSIQLSDETAIYLSNDNVNFVKVHIQHEDKLLIEMFANTENAGVFSNGVPVFERNRVKISGIYEFRNDIVVSWGLDSRQTHTYLTTPAQPIYDELERLKSVPYIQLNGNILGFETPPVVEEGRTLVPMRFLFEQMGESVTWDDATQTATVRGSNDVVSFSIDNTTAKVNGTDKKMDVPARLINSKTMVPLRFLSEELGYNVEWDEEHNMAIITQ